MNDTFHKPFRCRYDHRGKALELDVRDALDQTLSGLPYVLWSNKIVVDKSGNRFRVDLQVVDRRSKRYAIIECKNVRSKNPYTNEVELIKASRPLSFFRDDRVLKICIVNKRRKLSDSAKKKIDHSYKFHIKAKIYDWSTDLDWLRMAYVIRKAILRYYGWKERVEFCSRLLDYAENNLDLPKRKRRQFLTEIGIKNAHGMVYGHDKMRKRI